MALSAGVPHGPTSSVQMLHWPNVLREIKMSMLVRELSSDYIFTS